MGSFFINSIEKRKLLQHFLNFLHYLLCMHNKFFLPLPSQ